MNGNGTELEQVVDTHRSRAEAESWPRGSQSSLLTNFCVSVALPFLPPTHLPSNQEIVSVLVLSHRFCVESDSVVL